MEFMMKIKTIIHKEEEGFWAEVPAIPGCVTQGDSMDELIANLHEAIEGCLQVEIEDYTENENSEILELAV
jgi:predicted RNase H-like HicB family nuclease